MKINFIPVYHFRFFLVLKSRGIPDGDNIIRKLMDSDPKFVPILQTKIPQHLIPLIWNDPLVKNIASNFGPEKVNLIVQHFY